MTSENGEKRLRDGIWEPRGIPMFVCPEIAAKYFGLPEDYVRDLLKGPNPIPHIPRGRNKLVCVPLAERYLIDRCLRRRG